MAEKNDTDFVISRTFAAPRALVWQAWTEPQHLAAWWGPHTFTNRVVDIDLRAGGRFRIVMRDIDGVDYPMSGVYDEVKLPERLVYRADLSEHPDAWHDAVDPSRDKSKRPSYASVTTVTFVERGDKKTEVTVRIAFESAAQRARFVAIGMTEGWSQSFERLDADLLSAPNEIVGVRVFAAPRELVWRVFTEREHIAEWWGPRGFRLTIEEMDVRVGGHWRFVMHGPDGTDYKNHHVYRELKRPERIVMSHVAPKFDLIAVLSDEGQKTRVTWRMIFDSVADRDRVAREHGAVEGLSQTMARLAERLSSLL